MLRTGNLRSFNDRNWGAALTFCFPSAIDRFWLDTTINAVNLANLVWFACRN